jgi:hypothetical protein
LSGFTEFLTAARTPGRILPAAHPQTELTTTITVPFCWTAWSTSAAVRVSSIPAEVSSWRIGAIIISGYIHFPPNGFLSLFYQGKTRSPNFIAMR